MQDIDLTFEGDVSVTSPSAETCSVCGKRLSKYNKLGYCFHHPDPKQEKKRLEREDRLAGLVEKKSLLPVTPEVPPSDTTAAVVEKKEGLPSQEKVIELTCGVFEINLEELTRKGRQTALVRARHVLMYLLYVDTSLSYPAIGDLLSGRDHTTIIHGVSKITEDLETNAELQNLVRYIRSQYFLPLTKL